MTRRQIAAISLALLGFPTCAAAQDSGARVNALADGYVAAYFAAFPHNATLYGVAMADHDRLPDISPAAIAKWQQFEDSIFNELERIAPVALAHDTAAAVTHGFLRELIRNARDWRVCRMELWNVSPTWTGWQSEFAGLAASQPLGTPAQEEAALRRFGALPRYLAQERANLRRGLAAGYSAPKGNVAAVIRQLDALIDAPVAESPYVAMARDTASAFHHRLVQLEEETIRPALVQMRDFLRDEYLPAARDAIAVSANPDGAACYEAAIRYHATVALAAEEVHRTGLAQMARIRAEMAQISDRSFGGAPADSLLRELRENPEYQFRSREEMLEVARGALERARAAIPDWFGLVPEASVVVEPVPAFAEASAPGGFYTPPAEDGSRPGVYTINLHEADNKPRAGLEATAFHETYPGHHLQAAVALERGELHPASRFFYLSGFGEGWGLYSERLAEEMGLYTSDVDRMGLLSNEAMRAARLVVDAGMHALGWSREQAIEYMLANTAESRSSATAEIDRYIAVPGQATSYMLGNLEIRRLRALAESRLGEDFDIRAFHDRVLEDGSVPLMMLREKIERWIAATTGR